MYIYHHWSLYSRLFILFLHVHFSKCVKSSSILLVSNKIPPSLLPPSVSFCLWTPFRLNQSKVADRGQTQNHAGSLHSPQVRQVRFGESRFSDEKMNEWNWFVNALAVVQDVEFSFVLKAELRPRTLLFAPLWFLTPSFVAITVWPSLHRLWSQMSHDAKTKTNKQKDVILLERFFFFIWQYHEDQFVGKCWTNLVSLVAANARCLLKGLTMLPAPVADTAHSFVTSRPKTSGCLRQTDNKMHKRTCDTLESAAFLQSLSRLLSWPAANARSLSG